MSRKKVSVLVSKSTHKKVMNFRIDPAVAADVKTLNARIAKEAPGNAFDWHSVVENALRAGVTEANQLLNDLGKKSGAIAKAADGPASERD
jgi:hypothetical protein